MDFLPFEFMVPPPLPPGLFDEPRQKLKNLKVMACHRRFLCSLLPLETRDVEIVTRTKVCNLAVAESITVLQCTF